MRLAVVGLAVLLASCDSRPLVVGESSAAAGLPERARPTEQRCLDAAQSRATDEECWPTRQVGSWRGFITGDARYRHVLPQPLPLPSEEVLLQIEPQGTGTLLFGVSPVLGPSCAVDGGASPLLASADEGMDAGLASCGTLDAAALDDAPEGAQPGLLLGHRYALDELRMSGSPEGQRKQDPQVAFSLLIAAPWRVLCSDPPGDVASTACVCSADGCDISTETLEVSLLLSRDGRALRGTVLSSSDPELAAGLELVRQ